MIKPLKKQNKSPHAQTVNIADKLALFQDLWSPKIIGEFNEMEIKAVKLKGDFVWHKHKNADEMFWVIKGNLIIHLRNKDILVQKGEFVIIPRNIEHKPEAPKETHIILIEPKGTINTGNAKTKQTVKNPARI